MSERSRPEGGFPGNKARCLKEAGEKLPELVLLGNNSKQKDETRAFKEERTTSGPPSNFARRKLSGGGTGSRPAAASSLHRAPITCFTSTLTAAVLRRILPQHTARTQTHYLHLGMMDFRVRMRDPVILA
ncbi:hypothetical protein EYF80_027756 [Liparis tanakae]|uniref:Uncharacterized protein n=1 Tax=Liparis tanakae TaxID=230148 RepID=A0A4Z2H804_9TELE|nr:hypothetical protein EYF80_027756 [Liparis tanakae]